LASLPRSVLRWSGAAPRDDYPDDVLPFEIYRGTRQNIERIADQINKSFFFGIYDGCAVLMRRLVEMLLILAFKAHGLEAQIRGPDRRYHQLSAIIDAAVGSSALDLSRNSKEYLELFREKGDLSAHNPFHNARRKDMQLIQHKFRALIEELLYKAAILE
jgi:hypothetical protein